MDGRKNSYNVPLNRKSSAYDRRGSFGLTIPRRSKSSSELRAEDELSPPGFKLSNEATFRHGNQSPALQRKTSTFFSSASNENLNEEDEIDSRERFRKILREMYVEQERDSKRKYQQQFQQKLKTRLKEQQNDSNQLVNFIVYMATEHETLLQFLVFLPLIVTAFYIVLIEEGSLIHEIK